MIVKAVHNNVRALPSIFDDYAITQDDVTGVLDVTIGKHYPVYATKIDEQGTWYFVPTDTDHADGMWWMPSGIYEVIDNGKPAGWVTNAEACLTGYPVLFDWNVEEGIIDYEADAVQALHDAVAQDKTFPSQQRINDLNQSFLREEQQKLDDLRAEAIRNGHEIV